MKKESWGNYLKDKLLKIREWMRPDPGERLMVRIPKFLLKCIALLVLIALSPAMLVALAVIFFATL